MSTDAVVGTRSGGATALAEDVLRAIRALTSGADATTAPGWAWDERSQVIESLDRSVELLSLFRSRLLVAHRTDGRWARGGDRSFEDYRGRTSRQGKGSANAEMREADGFAEMPEAVRAVEEGQVGLAHARVLTRLRAASSDAVRTALDAGGSAELLQLAEGLDAPTFARRAAAWAAACDTEAAEQSFEAVRRRRYVRAVDRDGGTRIEGFVDPVAGARFRSALEALTPVPSADDTRTPEQRAADALTTMSARVLDQGADKIGAQVRPHLSVIVPADAWVAVRSRRVQGDGGPSGGSTGSTGSDGSSGVAGSDGVAGAPVREPAASTGSRVGRERAVDRAGAGGAGHRPSSRSGAAPSADAADGAVAGSGGPRGAIVLPELDDGTVIPLSQLDLLACDCELTRMVLDAKGIPLDVGRTERTYSKELRRAVLVRDRHCRWPGCTIRAAWCEVHHVHWVSRGGVTSAENAIALCSFHHHEVHRRHVSIRPTAGGHVFTRRDGTEIGASRRDTGIVRMIPSTRGGGPAARTMGDDAQATGRASTGVGSQSAVMAGSVVPSGAEAPPAGMAGSPPPSRAGSPPPSRAGSPPVGIAEPPPPSGAGSPPTGMAGHLW